MDFLLDNLAPIKKKKRSTYQKVADEAEAGEAPPPPITGSSSLFDEPETTETVGSANVDAMTDGALISGDVEDVLNAAEDVTTSSKKLTDLFNSLYDEADDLEKDTTHASANDLPTQLVQHTSPKKFVMKMSTQGESRRNNYDEDEDDDDNYDYKYIIENCEEEDLDEKVALKTPLEVSFDYRSIHSQRLRRLHQKVPKEVEVPIDSVEISEQVIKEVLGLARGTFTGHSDHVSPPIETTTNKSKEKAGEKEKPDYDDYGYDDIDERNMDVSELFDDGPVRLMYPYNLLEQPKPRKNVNKKPRTPKALKPKTILKKSPKKNNPAKPKIDVNSPYTQIIQPSRGVESQTQIMQPTTGDNVQTQAIVPPKNNLTQTQVIKPPSVDNVQTQAILSAKTTNTQTQLIQPSKETVTKPQSDAMNKPIMEDTTQQIPISKTQHKADQIKRTQMLGSIDYTQQISYTEKVQESGANVMTQRVVTFDKTQKVVETSFTEPDNTYEKTQADVAHPEESTLDTQPLEPETQVDQTMRDSPAPLKIHQLQKEAKRAQEEEQQKKMVEYIRPAKKYVPKVKFSKEDFLADFDNSEDENDEKEIDIPVREASPDGIDDYLDSSTIGFKYTNIKTETTETKSQTQQFHISGLKNYETELRKELTSGTHINLDDDDDDSELEVIDKRTSYASKATLLDIRVRLSKGGRHTKAAKDNQPNSGKLFKNLMQANKKQILEHRKEVIDAKGLDMDDMEKEKEIVENLLEQEILRNKKIRQREKQREKKQESGGASDFDYSDNELRESDVTDDGESNDVMEDDSDIDTPVPEQIDTNNEDNDIDDEDEILVARDKNRVRRTIQEENSSGEEEEDHGDDDENHSVAEQSSQQESVTDNFSSPTKHAIDLGNYGSNLAGPTSNTDRNTPTLENEDSESSDDDIDDEARIRLINEEKQKRLDHERKAQKKRDDLKKRGVSNFVEEEAEESEDEWFGVGGADGEGADGYDPELEKMIDDYSKADFNPDQIREMLAKENKDADVQMVEKILYDLKNGGLRKRGRAQYDLELSDDDDEDLREYRLKRRELMRQRRLDLGEDKLVKNPKSKAFFESMVEDIIDSKNPFGAVEIADVPSEVSNEQTPDMPDTNSSKEDSALPKMATKKFTLSEDFVQKSLSFLNETNKDVAELENDRKLARIQHGKDVDDLSTLKKHSSIKSFKSLNSSQSSLVNLDDPDSASNVETGNDDNDDDNNHMSRFRHPSILKLFGSKTDINDKFKEGSKSVRVTNSYRSVGGNRAAVTSLGKTRKLMAPKKKNRGFLIGGERRSNLSQLFNKHNDSFE